MELTKSTIRRFNDLNRRVFSRVSVKHPLYLNGSYRYSPWASDIDLYTRVPPEELEKVLRVLLSIDDDAEMVFLKLKIGEHKTKDKSLLKDPDRVHDYLAKAEPGRRWVKCNWLLWTGATIEEVSVVYDLGKPVSKARMVASIKNDIAKYEAVPDMYKALKRRRLLLKNKAPIDKILNDTRLGLMYLCRVRAETLQKAKGLFPQKVLKKARGNLRQSLRVVLGFDRIMSPDELRDAMNRFLKKAYQKRF